MAEEITPITTLPELTTPNKADLAALVDDVSGSPTTKKATLNNALSTPVDYRDFDENDSVGTPASGNSRLNVGTDGKAYLTDDGGNKVAVGEGALSHAMHGRLSLVSGDPFGVDPSSPTSIYYTPCNGNTVRMYDTTLSAWKNLTFSELEWKTEDTQTGDTTNGSAVITDLTDTSLFVVGMEVSGTGIGADAVISSIDSATQVTLDTNSTADGNDVSITFAAPVDAVYDLFLELQSGSVALRRPVAWTSQTTRATALTTLDGVKVLTGDTDSIYIGTVSIDDTTDGEIWGFYNEYQKTKRVLTTAKGMATTFVGGYMSSADMALATWVPANSNLYDGDTGTYVDISTVTIDFGSDVVFDEIGLYLNTRYYANTSFTFYGSDTGSFAGEETTVGTMSISSDGTDWWDCTLNSTYQFRYWKIYGTGTSGGSSEQRIYDVRFHYGTTLAVKGVDWGSNVRLWNGASIVETVNSDSLTKPGIVEFTAAVTSVDRITFTTGDGVTPAEEFDINPASGDLYNFS